MHSSPSKPAHYPPAKISSLGSWKLNLQVFLFQTTLKHHGPNHPKKHQETTKLNSIHSIPPNIFGLKTWFFPSHLNSRHRCRGVQQREPSGPSFPKTFDSRRRGSNRSERRVRGASSCGAFSSRRISSTWRFRRWFSWGRNFRVKKKQNKRELKKPRLEFLRSKTKRLPGV